MPRVALTDGQQGAVAMLQRALRIDAATLARLRQRGDHVDIFVQTPFGVLGSRTAVGTLEGGEVVARAEDLVTALAGGEVADAQVLWQGVLPPETGFQLVDEVPAGVVSDLARKGKDLVRQFSGPLGPPVSLLNQDVLQVSGGGVEVGIPMRMIFAAVNLGFVPGAQLDVPRHLRVSANGRWVRLDAAFGTVWYQSGGMSLF